MVSRDDEARLVYKSRAIEELLVLTFPNFDTPLINFHLQGKHLSFTLYVPQNPVHSSKLITTQSLNNSIVNTSSILN